MNSFENKTVTEIALPNIGPTDLHPFLAATKILLQQDEILGITKLGNQRTGGMPDGTGANRDEVDRVIAALTDGELLKLKHFAAFRVRSLGRASCGRTWEDLLGEANLSTLGGAANNGRGRHWKGNVDLVTHLCGAMRSISSHWKRDFDEQEADLESDLPTRIEDDASSALDNAVSHGPSPERELAAREQWNLIVRRCQGDRAATQVLEGKSLELSASEIMHDYELTKWQYQQAMKRIRLSSSYIDHLGIAGI